MSDMEGKAERLCSSFIGAVCVSPILIISMCALIGWNEQQNVCIQRALDEGEKGVKTVSAGADPTQSEGKLILFTGNISQASLQTFNIFPAGPYHDITFKGVGVTTQSEMYQCKETTHTNTETDSNGHKVSRTSYTYGPVWSSSLIDSSNFNTQDDSIQRAEASCWNRYDVRENPAWDDSLPAMPGATQKIPQSVQVGAFTTAAEMNAADAVSIDVPFVLQQQDIESPGVVCSRNHLIVPYAQDQLGSPQQACTHPQIGDKKVTILTSRSNLTVTVIGKNTGGTISTWTASASWGCKGSAVGSVEYGAMNVADFFTKQRQGNTGRAWILRILGFALIWFGVFLCFGPLGAAADCVPCIGECLSESIDLIGCVCSCPPAFACALGVGGVVWVGMRPLIGIPCMVVWLAIMCGFGAYIANSRANKANGRVRPEGYDSEPDYEAM